MEITLPQQFKENRYLHLKGIVPADICKIVTKYGLIQEDSTFSPELGEHAQVKNAHSFYADTLMETMLHFLLPHMEKSTGLNLCPTYSYYRVYRPGNILERHKDRPSCEISTTVCFGYKYITDDPNYKWVIYVDKDSWKTGLFTNRQFESEGNPGQEISQNPGDLLVYRGCEIEHWRNEFVADPGSYQVQGFFHYIDKDGPYYPEFAYDQRAGLGHKNRKSINN